MNKEIIIKINSNDNPRVYEKIKNLSKEELNKLKDEIVGLKGKLESIYKAVDKI